MYLQTTNHLQMIFGRFKMTYYNTIKNWVAENYSDTTCYDLKELANEVWRKRPTAELENVIENWIDAEVQSEIENNPEDYYVRTTTGGFGFEGCAKNEDIYDEKKARERVIEEFDVGELLENDEVREAFRQWVVDVM